MYEIINLYQVRLQVKHINPLLTCLGFDFPIFQVYPVSLPDLSAIADANSFRQQQPLRYI